MYWDNTPNVEPIYLPQWPNKIPWVMWQYASERNWLGFDSGKEWGIKSHSVDINVWHKSKMEMVVYLASFAGNAGLFDVLTIPPTVPAELTDKQMLDALWEAAHEAGWKDYGWLP